MEWMLYYAAAVACSAIWLLLVVPWAESLKGLNDALAWSAPIRERFALANYFPNRMERILDATAEVIVASEVILNRLAVAIVLPVVLAALLALAGLLIPVGLVIWPIDRFCGTDLGGALESLLRKLFRLGPRRESMLSAPT